MEFIKNNKKLVLAILILLVLFVLALTGKIDAMEIIKQLPILFGI